MRRLIFILIVMGASITGWAQNEDKLSPSTMMSYSEQGGNISLNASASKADADFFDVVISKVGLATLYLDFPVEIPYTTYSPDLLGVYYIIGIKGKELLAARLKNNIPAYTGVIVQGNAGTYRFYKTEEADALKYPSLLSGSTTDISTAQVLRESKTTGYVYTLGRGTDHYLNFYRYSESTLAANKAFLIYDDGNAAKQLTLNLGDDATGINFVKADKDNGAWYTIQGIRLNGKPMQRGLYIHNGSTYMIQ